MEILSSVFCVFRRLFDAILAAFCGAWAGGLVLAPFSILFYGDRSHITFLVYALPFNFLVLFALGTPVWLIYQRLSLSSLWPVVACGGFFGALVSIYLKMPESILGIVVYAVSGSVAALIWVKMLKPNINKG